MCINQITRARSYLPVGISYLLINHISKYNAGEEAPIQQKKKRSTDSSERDTLGSKACKVQTAFPVVTFVVNDIA